MIHNSIVQTAVENIHKKMRISETVEHMKKKPSSHTTSQTWVAIIPKLQANQLLSHLRVKDVCSKDLKIKVNETQLWQPVLQRPRIKGITYEKKLTSEFEQIPHKQTFKQALQEQLSKRDIANLKTAFEQVGTIAILEIDEEQRDKEALIAKTLLAINPQIKTVLRKDGAHEGIFRAQKMKYLAGIDTKETIHKENGVQLKINVETVYFSARLSRERARIAHQVRANERVLVMFSGAAPYPCVIAKTQSSASIVGVEINPQGHFYGQENIKLNKLKNVTLYCADMHTAVAMLLKNHGVKKGVQNQGAFDRIIMPLPKTADDFLPEAFALCSKRAIIHFYDFLHEDHFTIAEQKLQLGAKKAGFNCNILAHFTCGMQGVKTYRICVDALVERI